MDLKCPVCGHQMINGEVAIHGTFAGFLIFGLSQQHCWFYPKNGGERQLVAKSDTGIFKKPKRADASCCKNCNSYVVLPTGE